MTNASVEADVVILGAGSGGYACALRAVQLGLTAILVEADRIGGTCLHRGCIPTKAMLHAAEVADAVRSGPGLGVQATLAGIDIEGVNQFKAGVVQRLYKGLTGLIEHRGIRVVSGIGTVKAPGAVDVDGQTITARHVVVATGSRPRVASGLEIAGHVITSDQALGMDWIPRTAVILGGGMIGVEFASLWRSFGAQVALVEAVDRLVPYEDEASSKLLQRAFRRRGIVTKTGVTVTDVTEDTTGVHVTVSDGGTLDTDILLVAVGRAPNTEGLGLEDQGVNVERGYVIVDEQCRTGVDGIWAIGDIVPGPQLAHRGFAQGIAVAERIAGLEVPPLVDSGIPRIAYCDPEIASVGLTEAQAVARYGADGIAVETQTLGGNARSLVLGTSGMVKVIRVDGGPILGIHIVGSRAGELIGEAQLIVNWEALPEEVAALVHAHPTQTEALGEAHLALAGKPLHAHG
ncbi:MAG: dihydrolipoyl dehydrogenase [Bifidobacteriaceae bacterium]|nr:dihydrolipoyl dehydrogenase [Bifidobacteriaceae bacterium]